MFKEVSLDKKRKKETMLTIINENLSFFILMIFVPEKKVLRILVITFPDISNMKIAH